LAGKLAPALKQAVVDGGQDDRDNGGQSARNDTVQGGRTGEQAR
jgi:hypothetical protein